MPINPSLPLRRISQKEFASIDYQVMRHAFDCQKELGRLCDEVIYQNDLAARLGAAGLGPIRTGVPVDVTHGSFGKKYMLDLVVGDASIYELKTTSCLAGEHEAQLLNYLLLNHTHHGKLVNFRPPHVESKFVNTGLTTERRHNLTFNTARWRESDRVSQAIREFVTELLADWGGFLELSLYADALTHFLGGEVTVVQKVPLFRNGISLGNQRLHLAAPEIAFRLTALNRRLGAL